VLYYSSRKKAGGVVVPGNGKVDQFGFETESHKNQCCVEELFSSGHLVLSLVFEFCPL